MKNNYWEGIYEFGSVALVIALIAATGSHAQHFRLIQP